MYIIGFNPDFERVPSVFYASNKERFSMIENEFKIRKKHNLPVDFLDRKDLKKNYKFEAQCALVINDSVQIDTYLAAT